MIWLNAATFLWSFALIALVRVPAEDPAPAVDDEPEERMLTEITAGFSIVGRDRDLRTIALLVGAQSWLWGFLSVFLVVIAARELGTGPEGLGYLNAVLGVGTVLGGLMVLGRVAKGHLAQDMAIGVLGLGTPVPRPGDRAVARDGVGRAGRHRHQRPVGQPRVRDDPAAARARARHLPGVRRRGEPGRRGGRPRAPSSPRSRST